MDSFIAYEKGGRQLPIEDILPISRWATDSLTPDLTIVLDISPQSGLFRRGELDRMESQPVDFHERVRAAFLDLAAQAPGRYLVVDAEMTSEAISTIINARCSVFIETK